MVSSGLEKYTQRLGRYTIEQHAQTREIEAWFEPESLVVPVLVTHSVLHGSVIKGGFDSHHAHMRVNCVILKSRSGSGRPPPKFVVSSYNELFPSMEKCRSNEEQMCYASQASIHGSADDVACELEDLADTSTRKLPGKKKPFVPSASRRVDLPFSIAPTMLQK